MKKSAKLKRKTIKLIVKNLIVFAVLIAVMSVGVRSWFNYDSVRRADATGLNGVKCSVPEGLEVAIVAPGASLQSDTVWHDESFLITANEYSFLGAMSFTEITSDGKNFIKPLITQYGTVAIADTTRVNQWSTATANSEYLSFDMYLRSTAASAVVSLDKDSYCGPLSSTQQWGDSVNGWSPNTVIGAVRVAIEDATNTADLQQRLLWVPAPFLHFDPVSRNGDNQLIDDIVNTTNTYGLLYYNESNNEIDNHDGTYNHGYYSMSGNTATHNKIMYSDDVDDAGTNVTANPSISPTQKYHLPYDVPITDQFSDGTQVTYDGVSYYQHRIRVNIWIEGEDPESRAAQVTGKFKTILNLKLTGT